MKLTDEDREALEDFFDDWWVTCETPTVYYDGEHLASTLLAEALLASPELATIVARHVAAALNAAADEIERTAAEHKADDEADGCESRFCAGWLLGQDHAAAIVRTANDSGP